MKKQIIIAGIILIAFSVFYYNYRNSNKALDEIIYYLELMVNEKIEIQANYKSSFKVTESVSISNIEQYKNINYIVKVKRNVVKQKEIDDLYYKSMFSFNKKWKNKLIYLKTNGDLRVKQTLTFIDNITIALDKAIVDNDLMRDKQQRYYTNNFIYLDYLIDNNNNFEIKENKLVFKNNEEIIAFNNIYSNYSSTYTDYKKFVEHKKDNMLSVFQKANKELKIGRLDKLIKLISN